MAGRRPGGFRRRALDPARVVVIGFVAVIALGTLLLLTPWASPPGQGCTPIEALFTSTSAVCVTGLVVKSTGNDFTLFGQLVILVLIQVGGLGYMTLATFVALLFGRRISLRDRMALRDSLNVFSLEEILHFTRRIFKVTLALELAGTVVLGLYWLRYFPWPRALYLGLFHAVSAFNNAGFSLFDTSLAGWRGAPAVTMTVMALVVTGGLGFVVISELYLLARRRLPRLSLHSRVVLSSTAILIGGGALIFALLEARNPVTLGGAGHFEALQIALFQAVTPRTAGFSTVDVAALMPGTLMVLMLLMVIGASPGGTGGGVKTTTVVAIVASLRGILRGDGDALLGRRRLAADTVGRATFVFMAAGSYIMLFTVLLVAVEERNVLGMWFEVVSAFGTVGLSLGDGGVLSLSALLSGWGKLIVTLTMFVGRIGLMTVGLALVRREAEVAFRYPEERILIG